MKASDAVLYCLCSSVYSSFAISNEIFQRETMRLNILFFQIDASSKQVFI